MPHKSIVMVGPLPPQVGGIETFVFNLMHSNLVQKHDITLINISKPLITKKPEFRTLSGYRRCFGRGLKVLMTSYSYSALFFLKFLWTLFSRRVDIVHLHTASYTSFWEKCAYILVAKTLRKKVIIHMHASRFEYFYDESHVLFQKWIAYFLSLCDHVIVLSKSWYRFYTRLIDADRLELVPNGIDLRVKSSPEKSETPRIVFLGEVGRRKGIYDLIDAARILKEKGMNIEYDIIGPGEIDRAKKAAVKANLKNEFNFHGPMAGEQKLRVLSRGWIMSLPSYAEGMPLAVLEAMAAGCAIVSSSVGGIPDVIDHGKHGYLFNPGDVKELANNLSRLVDHPTLLHQFQKASLERVRAFDLETCADLIDRLYQGIGKSSNVRVESTSNNKVLV